MLALHAGEMNLQPGAGATVEADADTYRSEGFGRGRRAAMFADRRDRLGAAVSASGVRGAPNV